MSDSTSYLSRLYDNRFDQRERLAKARVWKTLCERFFQRYVPRDAVILDPACGFGEFLTFIEAGRKIGVDLNPGIEPSMPDGLELHQGSADDLAVLESASVDVVFVSNFFEHLPDKAAMDRVLQECGRVLRPGGTFLALQPNIRYAADRYWDFYDHHLPLSHLSAAEGFTVNGFQVRELIPRFLPWSTKSRLPQHPLLVAAYLAFRPAWRLLGKQFFLVAEKP
jgi:SAM-dependent methyltransferase